MALQMSLTSRSGENLDNAYACITGLNINKSTKFANITIDIYRSLKSKEQGFVPMESQNVIITEGEFDNFFDVKHLNGKNVFEKAYELIKTQGQYKDAIDV